MSEVILQLDDLTAQALAGILTARRQYLDAGTPISPENPPSVRRLSAVGWEIRHQLGLRQFYDLGPPNPYQDPDALSAAITLRVDRATARDLDDTLCAIGEYFAAGTPIARRDKSSERRLAAIVQAIR